MKPTLTLLAALLLAPLAALNAQEAAANTPKRSAFIYMAYGVHSLNYQILKEGKGYEFSRSLKPLEKHRDVITPISGLHHPGSLSHHHGCGKVWLTGGKLGPTDRNTISVDQKMAEVTAQHTRFPSLEMGGGSSLAWTADGVQLPAMRRCDEIFSAPRDDTARASCGNGAKANSYHFPHLRLVRPGGTVCRPRT
jgi:hypothetical protein